MLIILYEECYYKKSANIIFLTIVPKWIKARLVLFLHDLCLIEKVDNFCSLVSIVIMYQIVTLINLWKCIDKFGTRIWLCLSLYLLSSDYSSLLFISASVIISVFQFILVKRAFFHTTVQYLHTYVICIVNGGSTAFWSRCVCTLKLHMLAYSIRSNLDNRFPLFHFLNDVTLCYCWFYPVCCVDSCSIFYPLYMHNLMFNYVTSYSLEWLLYSIFIVFGLKLPLY